MTCKFSVMTAPVLSLCDCKCRRIHNVLDKNALCDQIIG